MASLVNLLQHQQPLKVNLYRSLHEKLQNGPCFHANFIRKVAGTMKSAFTERQSTSLMICGESEICMQVIRQVQQLLLSQNPGRQVTTTNEEISRHTARISGQLVDADSSAIVSLANQFLLRKRSDRDMNSALEDLQVYFAARKVEGFPATIIIEDFDRYSMQKRQTLIYTLLDMLHSSEYLFIVIGLTSRLDAFAHLERRVASRMASQHLTLPFPQPAEICAELSWLLTQHNPFDMNNSHFILSQEDEGSMILKQQFNDSVEALFGRFRLQLLSLIPLTVPTTNQDDIALLEGSKIVPTDDPMIIDQEMDVADESSMTVAQLTTSEAHKYEMIASHPPGQAFDTIATLVALGQDRRYFQQVAINLVRLLTPVDKIVTLEMFQRAFELNEPQVLVDKLCELSTMELTLYTVIAHKQCQRVYGGNEIYRSPVEQTVDEIVKNFDRVSNCFGNGMPMTQVMHYFHRLQSLGLISLWTGVKGEEVSTISQLSMSFGPSMIVTAEHTTAEIMSAYKEDEFDSLLTWRPMKEKSKLKISDRIRRFVLQPQTVILARDHDGNADQKSLLSE